MVSILNPWEDGEFILIIMPNLVDTIDDAREDVGNLLIRSRASSKVAVVASMEGDVACIDGSSSLECCFDFR